MSRTARPEAAGRRTGEGVSRTARPEAARRRAGDDARALLDEDVSPDVGALEVLRRGLAISPELRAGLYFNRFTEFSKSGNKFNEISETTGFNVLGLSYTERIPALPSCNYTFSLGAGYSSDEPTKWLQNELVHETLGQREVPVGVTRDEEEFVGSLSVTHWVTSESLERDLFVGAGVVTGTMYHEVFFHLGFLWFATYAGLQKYDGHRFTTYTHRPGDPTSLPDQVIQYLYQDRSGGLWVGTGAGLSRLDRERDIFVTYTHDPDDRQASAATTSPASSRIIPARCGWVPASMVSIASIRWPVPRSATATILRIPTA